MTAPDDRAVRDQYEAHPYPARDPADEAGRLITGSPSHLLEVEHYVYAGRRAGALTALVAGGGTGDGAIMLAQHLADRGGGSVHYLDLSTASLEVARARAAARQLDNITFHHGSLLDLDELGLGPFDYIDCCGVLHHLAEPDRGLAALVAALKDDGGLGLMLYGALGRHGVYPAQRAIRRLAGDQAGAERLRLARALVADLPAGNWLKRNPHLADHLGGDDAGFTDLLLHPRDRAYLVPEILAMTAAAGLRISGFLPPGEYDPANFLADDELRDRARALPEGERWALAEDLSGALKTHVFYAVKAGNRDGGAARPDDPAMVPVLREMPTARLAESLAKSPRLSARLGGVDCRFELPADSAEIVALIDGGRSLRQIHGRLRAAGAKLDWAAFKARFDAIYAVLHPLNMLLLAGR
ncbi:MAG: class I SAM-dependent methyltransferase [Alphaproteobacteria bacterium]|jgi:SAM-dependent methyltransferase|nr:class I SAM-dependent methyltransferase [Alphaproteobacteria bacterium]MDP6566405.1 class I SAM-dependent methyltransferase [Alphaproteobacteria bacterium]MDP6811637.1 class I SAM-dependent methyltransferase [Alphaproteobacteria bacterium]